MRQTLEQGPGRLERVDCILQHAIHARVGLNRALRSIHQAPSTSRFPYSRQIAMAILALQMHSMTSSAIGSSLQRAQARVRRRQVEACAPGASSSLCASNSSQVTSTGSCSQARSPCQGPQRHHAVAAAGSSGNTGPPGGSAGAKPQPKQQDVAALSDSSLRSLSPEARQVFKEAQDNIVALNRSRLRALDELRNAKEKVRASSWCRWTLLRSACCCYWH